MSPFLSMLTVSPLSLYLPAVEPAVMPAVTPAVASDHLHLEQQLVQLLVSQVALCRQQHISTDQVEIFQDHSAPV